MRHIKGFFIAHHINSTLFILLLLITFNTTQAASGSKFYIGGSGTAYNSLSEAESALKAKGDAYKPLTISDKWRENGKLIYKYTAPYASPSYGKYTYSYQRCEKTGGGFSTEKEAANTGAQLVYNNDTSCGAALVRPSSGTTWGTSVTPVYLYCGVNYYPYPNVEIDSSGKYGFEINGIKYTVDYNRRSSYDNRCFTGSDGLNIRSHRRGDCPLGYIAEQQPTLPNSPDSTHESIICKNTTSATIHEIFIVDEVKNTNTCPSVGNPILPSLGIKFQRETDYVSQGAFPLKINRIYNSLWSSYKQFWPLPNSLSGMWMLSYQAKVAKVKNSKSLYDLHAFRPDGTILYFTQPQTNTFTPYDKDINDTLKVVSIGGINFWEYYDASTQNTELYELSGQLRQIKTPAGNIHYLSYNPDGTLYKVIDGVGRELVFAYDTNQRISTITLPDNSLLTYTYNNNGMLESVTYPDNTKRTYHYEKAGFPTHLTGISDETNKRYATFAYDDQGRAISTEHAGGVEKYSVAYNVDGSSTVTDALGTNRTYTFKTVQGVTKLDTLTQPCNTCNGSSQKLTYDVNGNVDSRLDFKGNLTKYIYDLTRNLETKRTEGLKADGSATLDTRITNTEWHPTLRLPKRIALPRKIISYVYNGDGGITCGATAALCSKTIRETNDSNGSQGLAATIMPTPARTWAYTYNARGQVLTTDGPRTDVVDKTTYLYYSDTTATHKLGDLWKITNALGHVTTFDTYDANGRPLTITNANGISLSLTYTARGLLKSTSIGGGINTIYDYYPNQLLKTVTYPDGRAYTYGYDDAQRLTSITSKTGETTTYTLDALGNRLTETTKNASGVVTQALEQVFTPLSQLHKTLTSIQGNTATTEYGYDNNGNLKTVTSPLGDVVTYGYDALNRLVSEQFAADGKTLTTDYVINAQHLPSTIKAPNNASTGKTYNGFGEVLTETSPDRGTITYTYDNVGNVKTRLDARNITLTYTYDALNRLTNVISTAPVSSISYLYDTNGAICTLGKGRLCKVTDNSGTTEFAYNALGQPTKKTVTLAGKTYTTQTFFDTSGHPTMILLPNSRDVTYTRNAERRTTSINALVANTSSVIFSNALYRPDALLTSLTYGNGVGLSYSYDASGHRLHSNNTTALNASFLFENYSWDLEGNYKSRFSSSASGGYAANHSFLYDGFGRLKQESGTPTSQSFTYDDNSNRLRNGVQSYTYLPNTNRLYSRGIMLPTLDAAGNTLNNGLTSGLGQTYTWDSFGRLLSITTATGTTQYQYNYLNQRVSKTLSNGSKTLYHYDYEGRLFLETSSTGVMQVWYLYHDSGDIAAIIYGANSPYNATAQEQVLYIHSDHLGTPRIAFDSLKRVVWRWESDAFGTTLPLQDPDKDGKATVINLRFPGQYYDAESKLHYNWNRYYDPQLGRYISSDLIGLDGGLNTFGYVGQSPLVNIDYDGLFAQSPIPLPTAAPISGVATSAGLGAATTTAGVAAAFTAGYAVGSAIYPAIAEPLGDAIDSVVDQCKEKETCAQKYPNYIKCGLLRGYDYNSIHQAFSIFGQGCKKHNPSPSYGGPCANTEGQGNHWNIRRGKERAGSIVSCTCCQDTPTGPILRTKYKVVF